MYDYFLEYIKNVKSNLRAIIFKKLAKYKFNDKEIHFIIELNYNLFSVFEFNGEKHIQLFSSTDLFDLLDFLEVTDDIIINTLYEYV